MNVLTRGVVTPINLLQTLKRKLPDDGDSGAPSAWEQQREELIAACQAALGCKLQGMHAGIDSSGSTPAGAPAGPVSSPGGGSGSGEASNSSAPPRRPRLIVFNLFSLEGFHIAEGLGVPCLAASPCLPPYGPPAGFRRRFERAHLELFSRLQAAEGGQGGELTPVLAWLASWLASLCCFRDAKKLSLTTPLSSCVLGPHPPGQETA